MLLTSFITACPENVVHCQKLKKKNLYNGFSKYSNMCAWHSVQQQDQKQTY